MPGQDVRGVAFAVSNRSRVAATAYTRATPEAAWHVQVALFSPGSRPVWYDFSDHDPVDSADAPSPPSASTSVDTDPQGRLQLVWASTFTHASLVDGDGLYVRLRNVFAARSVTS